MIVRIYYTSYIILVDVIVLQIYRVAQKLR